MKIRNTLLVATACAALTACGSGENAQTQGNMAAMNTSDNMTMADSNQSDPQQLVDEAAAEVKKMKQDPKMAALLEKAKGVYLVPEFGRGAFVVGGRGGAGVVTARNGGSWTSPAFYDFGGISVGAQAGGSGGEVAFLLMTDNAVDAFMSGNQVTLNADSGLTIIDYSAATQASAGKGDIIMWSDTEGAYAGATISVSDLNWADGNNTTYYGGKVDPNQVLTGKKTNPKADVLTSQLPS